MKRIFPVMAGIAAVIPASADNARHSRPNVIYILADDMGYGDVRAYNPDSRIPTPVLDSLCSQGMIFTDAHSNSSLSTPTRYGIMTGRYCFRSSLKKGVLNGYSPLLLEPETTTVAELFKEAGYRTAVIGKWHLGLGWQKKDPDKKLVSGKGLAKDDSNVDFSTPVTEGPHTRGFDSSRILPASLDMPPYIFVTDGKVEDKSIVCENGHGSLDGEGPDRRVFWRPGSASASFRFRGVLDSIAVSAARYVKDNAGKGPFFLYVPMTAPHTPWLPGDEYADRSGAGRYGDFVCHLDAAVGRILEAVEHAGIEDSTIVVFASDNGAYWDDTDRRLYPEHSPNGIYRGMKADIWDGGHRVPFIVRWPGVVYPGSISDQLVCLTDFMATVADITGLELPESAQDSRSFLPAMKGKRHSVGRRRSVIHHSGPGMFAVRHGKWKYVEGQGSGGRSTSLQDVPDAPGQLYDMKRDPSESHNMYYIRPAKVKRLQKELAKCIQD